MTTQDPFTSGGDAWGAASGTSAAPGTGVPAYAPPPPQTVPGYGYQGAPAAVNRIGKTRNPWGVWALTLVTLGIYGIWWYYTINRELRDFDQQINVQPGMSVVALVLGGLIIIPPYVSIARTGSRIAQAQRQVGSASLCSSLIGLLLALIGFYQVYYQAELNKVWAVYGNPPEGSIRP